MELNELNELEAKLEELGKILLADDGFFAQMPKEQLEAFINAVTITARIEALDVLRENKSNMICDMVNGFTAKITPVFVGGEEPMHPMMEEPMHPMMGEPMHPMMEEPMHPMMGEPMMKEPMMGEPMMKEPMMGEPMHPMMGEPMMKEPMMEDFKCPNCDSGQCVCVSDKGDQKESTGDMPPMDNPEDTK